MSTCTPPPCPSACSSPLWPVFPPRRNKTGRQPRPRRCPTRSTAIAPDGEHVAAAPQTPADGAIAAALAQWKSIGQTDAFPFDSYAGFLMAHPGWPNEAANRRAAERKAATASPTSVVAFFTRFPPLTATGLVARRVPCSRSADGGRAGRRPCRVAQGRAVGG